jgi:hypothetical protein
VGNAFPAFRPKIIEHKNDAASPYSPVSTGDIAFCLVSSPTDGRRNVMSVMTCRDYLNDAMLKSIQPSYDFSYYRGEIPIDWNRLRLGIFFNKNKADIEEIHEKLLFAKKIINIYERIGKFSRNSTIIKADYAGKAEAWLVSGPKEWMKSSHLVSMVTLIFRMVHRVNLSYGKNKINNIKDIHDFFSEIRNQKTALGGDYYHSERFAMFEMFMRKYQQFFDLPQKVLFPKGFEYSWHGSGGIASLCSYQTYIRELDQNVEKEWKTWNPGK